MLGSVIRDHAIAFKATGGVYLTGSIAMALSEYFAEKTNFMERFARPGAQADEWVEKIPIYLVTNPQVAVVGALALAKEQAAS
jgi:glucokinase